MFCIVKGIFLSCKKPPFETQKVAFYDCAVNHYRYVLSTCCVSAAYVLLLLGGDMFAESRVCKQLSEYVFQVLLYNK